MLRLLSRFFRMRNAIEPPALVAVTRRHAAPTIEGALRRFEDDCSEENVDGVAIQECVERADGLLVRYEVRWKHSVFDDHAYGSHVSWALVVPMDPGAGDSPDDRYRVAAATADRHVR